MPDDAEEEEEGASPDELGRNPRHGVRQRMNPTAAARRSAAAATTEGRNLRDVESRYDSIAKEWADAFSGEHDRKPKDKEMLDRFSREVGDRRPVWDLGCGPGNTAKYLSGRGMDISGLDLSEKMAERARTLHPNIHFRKGNILELQFQSDSIAGVVAFYAMVHFTKEQVGAAFREIFRVLQPGGLLLFTYHVGDKTIHIDEFLGKTFDLDFMFFTSDFVGRCLKENGFEDVDIIEREPYPLVEYESRRTYAFAKKPP